jgi:hypothetical protein
MDSSSFYERMPVYIRFLFTLQNFQVSNSGVKGKESSKQNGLRRLDPSSCFLWWGNPVEARPPTGPCSQSAYK